MAKQENSQNKDIFYNNIKRDDALYQQAKDVQVAMKQIYDQEKKKSKISQINKKKGQKGNNLNSNDVSPNIKQHQQNENDLLIVQGWSEKPLEVDKLSLSNDIIKFNGPLINFVDEGGEELHRATLKIQKLWKAKYHTIKKVRQADQENNQVNDDNLKKKLIDAVLMKEFTFNKVENSPQKKSPKISNPQQKQESSPLQNGKQGSSPQQIQKVVPSPIKKSKASPQTNVLQKQEVGYLEKYKKKKNSEIPQEEGQEIKQKEFQLYDDINVPLRVNKIVHRDENKNYLQQHHSKDQTKIEKEQLLGEQDQKKNQIQKIIFSRPQSQHEQRSNAQIKKYDNLIEHQIKFKNNIPLEKRYMEKDQLVSQNQIINLQKKHVDDPQHYDKNGQLEKNIINPSPPQQIANKQDILLVVDKKKAIISQIISKQIQQKFDEQKLVEKAAQQQIQKPSIIQKPQKDEQKVQSLGSSKWELRDKEVLIKLVEVYGTSKWSEVATHLPNRTPEECQEMYIKLISL